MPDSAASHPLIQAVRQADSSDRLIGAVQALAAAQLEAGIPTLIAVLGFNNPGAAAIAVKGLVQMGAAAVQPLIDLLDDYNYGARAYAIRALAAIADPRALDLLVSTAATDFAPSVRRAATKGIGVLRWDDLPPDQRAAAQTQVLETLLQVSQDADWSLRYAAVVGLQALAAHQPTAADRLRQLLETDGDAAVQARSRLALERLSEQCLSEQSPASPVPISTSL